MLIPGLPANILTDTVSQALSGFASHAATGAKSFESDLDSGNVSGAQSFLSALQQKLSVGNSGASGVSAQITQVSNDLKSGNLAAAHVDFSQLKSTLAQQNYGAAQSAASGTTSGSSLAALASYSALQQGAFAGAVNLSMPANTSALSIDM